MIKTNYFVLTIFILFIAAFSSCSSSPKNSGDIYNLRIQSESALDSGNREAGRGNFENALVLISEAKRRATLADDPSLLIRCSLSRGNVLFSLGRTDEAFAEWDIANAEAVKSRDGELLSITKIYLARGRLVSGRDSAQSVLEEVRQEQANIKTNQIYIAFSWQVQGLALRAMNSFNEAESAIMNSLAIHEKESYLENISYDWYTIASIRSLSGNIHGALQALDTSISIDRRIENSWGLAASWRAMGDVYRKALREQDAMEAFSRARAIYAAMGNEHEVAETDRRMNNL